MLFGRGWVGLEGKPVSNRKFKEGSGSISPKKGGGFMVVDTQLKKGKFTVRPRGEKETYCRG